MLFKYEARCTRRMLTKLSHDTGTIVRYLSDPDRPVTVCSRSMFSKIRSVIRPTQLVTTVTIGPRGDLGGWFL